MKKVCTYKGFVIAVNKHDEYSIFTKDEWAFGAGFRYYEMEGIGSLREAKEWIDSY